MFVRIVGIDNDEIELRGTDSDSGGYGLEWILRIGNQVEIVLTQKQLDYLWSAIKRKVLDDD